MLCFMRLFKLVVNEVWNFGELLSHVIIRTRGHAWWGLRCEWLHHKGDYFCWETNDDMMCKLRIQDAAFVSTRVSFFQQPPDSSVLVTLTHSHSQSITSCHFVKAAGISETPKGTRCPRQCRETLAMTRDAYRQLPVWNKDKVHPESVLLLLNQSLVSLHVWFSLYFLFSFDLIKGMKLLGCD